MSDDKHLTKRERFASMALQGMLADGDYIVSEEKHAEIAVAYADALIAELAK